MLIQLLFNSIIAGLQLALVAFGFRLVFNTLRVFHLAHGAIYVLGGYIMSALVRAFNGTTFAFTTSVVATILVILLAGTLMELAVYRPMYKRGAGEALTLIASLGLYIITANFLAVAFGNETRFENTALSQTSGVSGLLVAPIQLWQLSVSALLILCFLMYSRSKFFLPVRAVMGAAGPAAALGVNVSSVRIQAILLGSLMAGVASILRLYDTGIDPQAGLPVTLTCAVAVITGGTGKFMGTLVAALIVSLLQSVGDALFAPQWKDAITFMLLIIVLLFKTEGIVKFKMRLEEK